MESKKVILQGNGTYEHPGTLVPKLAAPFGPFNSLLDVGGGGGTVGAGVWNLPTAVIDIWPPQTTPSGFTLGDALNIVEIYGAKSFDVVQACEVIEHLAKEDGFKLLTAMEAVARKFVILTCPNGFTSQEPDDYPHEHWSKNPYQRHLCGWTPEEFISLGYTVYLNPGGLGSQLIAWNVIE